MQMNMGLIMFDPISIGVASRSEIRVTGVSNTKRVSDLSSRSRKGEASTVSQDSADKATESRQRSRDPVGQKAKAHDSRDGKRPKTDATEEGLPRAKVKFRAPSKDGDFEAPLFEVEGQPVVKPGGPTLGEEAAVEAQEATGRHSDQIGSFVDLFA
ncbi:MAG: hypothetical protein ACI97A_003039 [Planctomycetota bacterium]